MAGIRLGKPGASFCATTVFSWKELRNKGKQVLERNCGTDAAESNARKQKLNSKKFGVIDFIQIL